VSDATTGQAPRGTPRIARWTGLGLAIALLVFAIGYLLGRRAPPPPITQASSEARAEPVIASLPRRPAARMRAPSDVAPPMERPIHPQAPEPLPAPVDATHERPERDIQPREPARSTSRQRAPPPPPRGARMPPQQPAPAPTQVVAVPVPVAVLPSGFDDQAARLAELERQRHLTRSERAVRPIDGAPMVRVEGTRFTMGDNHGVANQRPEHEVDVATFWIDQFEVSIEQGLRFDEAARAEGRVEIGVEGDAELPLADVSWTEAQRFCEWVGGSLPTEAQWELAARAIDGRDWPWGSDLRTDCVNLDLAIGSRGEAMPVDSLECGSGLGGIRHLVGNVAEWTRDPYALYTREPVLEPGSRGVRRVARGGSFLTRDERDATTHAREGVRPGTRRADLGFRCALESMP